MKGKLRGQHPTPNTQHSTPTTQHPAPNIQHLIYITEIADLPDHILSQHPLGLLQSQALIGESYHNPGNRKPGNHNPGNHNPK